MNFVVSMWPPQLLISFCERLHYRTHTGDRDKNEISQIASSPKTPQKLQLAMAYLAITIVLYNSTIDDLRLTDSIIPFQLAISIMSQMRNHAELKYSEFRDALGIIAVSGGQKRQKVDKLKKWSTWDEIVSSYPCLHAFDRDSDILLFLERKLAEFNEIINEPSDESTDGLVSS